jgi:hypothetical protein
VQTVSFPLVGRALLLGLAGEVRFRVLRVKGPSFHHLADKGLGPLLLPRSFPFLWIQKYHAIDFF